MKVKELLKHRKKAKAILAFALTLILVISNNLGMVEAATPRALGNGSWTVYTSLNSGVVLNCYTSASHVTSRTTVNVWSYTGNSTQKWGYDSSSYLFYPDGNKQMALNCRRGEGNSVDVVPTSINATTPLDMMIFLIYSSSTDFKIQVSSDRGYPSSYVTRRGAYSGASVYWTSSSLSSNQTWHIN